MSMRPAAWVLATFLLPPFLLLPSPALAETPVQATAEFATPAQLQGNATVDGLSWLLLVLGPAEQAAFGLELPDGGTATRHSYAIVRSEGAASVAQPLPLGSGPPEDLGPTSATIEVGASSWSALYVVAQDIRLEAGTAAFLQTTAAGDSAAVHLPARGVPVGTYRPAAYTVPAGDVAFSAPAEGSAPLPFSLRLGGLSRIEWHNATVGCSPGSAEPCPDGAQDGDAPAFPGTSARAMTYLDVRAPTGTLEGQGTTLALAGGGPSLRIGLLGEARLPEATLGSCTQGACAHPSGATFRAEGNLTFLGLQADPEEPDRMRTALRGTLAFAASDERPWPAGDVAAVVGGALLGLGVLLWLFVGLFARKPGRSLEHPRAAALMDLIRASPGLSFQDLLRRTGWPSGTVRHHLAKMQADGHVVAHPYRNTLRFFEDHGRHASTWREQVLLLDPDLRRLHAWLLGHPGCRQKQVVEAAAQWGWARPRAQRRLARLVEGGLAAKAPGRTGATYTAQPASVPPQP